jgi:TolC family type I secretion outer membrane protein
MVVKPARGVISATAFAQQGSLQIMSMKPGALFLALFAAMALVRPAAGETLTEALTQTYLGNPRLDAQRARLRAADERVPQALAGWRPTVETFGEAGYRHFERFERGIVDEDSNLFNRRIGAELNQPVFRGGQTIAATRGAENTVRAERARLWSVEQQVLLDATTAYVDVVRDQAVLDLTIRNEQRLIRQLEATQDRFRVGEVTRTDVFQAEARLARATADRIAAEGNLQASRATYRNVVGGMPGRLAKPPLPTPLPTGVEAAIAAAVAGNPDILAAEFDERSALDDVDRVRGELLPSVDLIGRAEREWDSTRENQSFTDGSALVRLTVPLYQAGSVYSRLRQQKQTVAQLRRSLDQARRNVQEVATQSFNDLETARAAIQSFKKQVRANEVALEGVQREAEVGARTVLDILDAEQELLDSQVDLVRSERDQVVASYQLVAALGALTGEKLQLPVEYYNPQAHYREVRGKWFGGDSTGDISGDFKKR